MNIKSTQRHQMTRLTKDAKSGTKLHPPEVTDGAHAQPVSMRT